MDFQEACSDITESVSSGAGPWTGKSSIKNTDDFFL